MLLLLVMLRVVLLVPLEQRRWYLRCGLMMLMKVIGRCRYRSGVGGGMTEKSIVR